MRREPTIKQAEAIATHVANGGSKADALRAVGYSEAIARNPQRVFNSPIVQAILEEAGVEIVPLIRDLHRMAKTAGKVDYAEFPPLRDQEDFNPFEDEEDTSGDEQLSDEEIRTMIEEKGGFVKYIKHTKRGRHVWFFAPDNKSKLEAMEKLINLHGIYAPKRTDLKVTVGVFTSYREKMEQRRKEGKIIDIGEKRDATTTLETPQNNETT